LQLLDDIFLADVHQNDLNNGLFVPSVASCAARYELAEQSALNFIDTNIKMLEASIDQI